MKKQWAVVTGAFALATSMVVQAQDGGNLLRQIGRAIANSPETSAERNKSPYKDAPGTYWDQDEDTLAGAQHVRAGLASTGSGGARTCDAQLIAMARSAYRLTKAQREQCLYAEWLIDTKQHGPNGITAQQTNAIERTYGAAFDARAERFRNTHRFSVRPNIDPHPTYDQARGTLDIYVPIPWINGFQVSGVTGEGFVPSSAKSQRTVWTPKNAGRYHLPIRMSESEANNLIHQGRDAKDDLIVFFVKRVWLDQAGPKAEVQVERVHVGYRNELIGVDLTKKKGEEL
ncbi:hypothetical protein FHT08_003269 [Xanthomonas campestris]|uniref:hypothetical protein n=1 Tax=Xanthomonas sp. CFBP 8151 TaxID=3035310 RepID=UPI00141AF0F2|nr:hypothetical protein [Xanthomonas sp. CFBP 8151]NIJ78149.1 hypothetical protein [Xanthomonas sp. CFBP 8151]